MDETPTDTQLAAAQAEVERLMRSESARELTLEKALAAAQAELEEQRAYTGKVADRCADLSTRLTNLREASERYIAWADGGDKQARESRAAIEASRVSR